MKRSEATTERINGYIETRMVIGKALRNLCIETGEDERGRYVSVYECEWFLGAPDTWGLARYYKTKGISSIWVHHHLVIREVKRIIAKSQNYREFKRRIIAVDL